MPDEVVSAIYDFIGKPEICPHGNPIADTDAPNVPRLCELPLGTSARIVRVLGELRHVMALLSKYGCWIGDEIKIVDKWKRGALLLCNGTEIAINLDVCKSLVVEVRSKSDDAGASAAGDKGTSSND